MPTEAGNVIARLSTNRNRQDARPQGRAFSFMLYEETGHLRYGRTKRLVVEVPQGLADYYRSLIPKWKQVNKQAFSAHITVVRAGKEFPTNKEVWKKYEGEEITFSYEPHVYEGTVYYWLNCFCTRLEEIRRELGLSVTSEYTLPPEGFVKCFHCTLGNKKEL